MRLIDADKLLQSIPNDVPYKASVKRVLMQAETVDAVPHPSYDQLLWERDLAIQQLREDFGVGLGEKKKDVAPVVRCVCCKHGVALQHSDMVMCYGKKNAERWILQLWRT